MAFEQQKQSWVAMVRQWLWVNDSGHDGSTWVLLSTASLVAMVFG